MDKMNAFKHSLICWKVLFFYHFNLRILYFLCFFLNFIVDRLRKGSDNGQMTGRRIEPGFPAQLVCATPSELSGRPTTVRIILGTLREVITPLPSPFFIYFFLALTLLRTNSQLHQTFGVCCVKCCDTPKCIDELKKKKTWDLLGTGLLVNIALS